MSKISNNFYRLFGRRAGGVGKKPVVKLMTSEEEQARFNLLRMQENGVTEFKWLHSGVDLACNGEDHSKLDGKRFNIKEYLKSGKSLPGSENGCRCTFTAVIIGFD